MESQRYFLKLAYKGTHFFGWQRQPNAITVQETIADALQKLNRNQPVKLTGCGRTDTGVHASDFFAHFDLPNSIDTAVFQYKLNCMLPDSIAIKALFPVPKDLHTRFSATSRTYHYFIHQSENPFLAETSWLVLPDLDLNAMNRAAKSLIGDKNFKSFSKLNSNPTSFNCIVSEAHWETTEHGLRFTISANRFLRNMVRAITGSLIDVGLGKKSPADFEIILQAESRSLAGKSAPAQGLFLVNVAYENDKDLFDTGLG